MTKPRYPQAILISCEVPWDENEQLLEDVFRQEIRHALDSFSHVYIFGTAGEGYAVDTPRFRRIVEVFRDETRSAAHAQVGVIALSVPQFHERIRFAYDLGFREFQIFFKQSLKSFRIITRIVKCLWFKYGDNIRIFPRQLKWYFYRVLYPKLIFTFCPEVLITCQPQFNEPGSRFGHHHSIT